MKVRVIRDFRIRDLAYVTGQVVELTDLEAASVVRNRYADPFVEGDELTHEVVEAMVSLLRGAAALNTINTPAQLMDFFVRNVVGAYEITDASDYPEDAEWLALTDLQRDRLSFKATVSAMLDLDDMSSPKETARSLAYIFLDQDELNALAGGDPLPRKMKRIRERRP